MDSPLSLVALNHSTPIRKKQGKAAEIYHSKGRQQKKRIVWPKLWLGPYRAAVQRTSRVQENTPFPVAAYIGGKEVII
jgi:hypothetical protein